MEPSTYRPVPSLVSGAAGTGPQMAVEGLRRRIDPGHRPDRSVGSGLTEAEVLYERSRVSRDAEGVPSTRRQPTPAAGGVGVQEDLPEDHGAARDAAQGPDTDKRPDSRWHPDLDAQPRPALVAKHGVLITRPQSVASSTRTWNSGRRITSLIVARRTSPRQAVRSRTSPLPIWSRAGTAEGAETRTTTQFFRSERPPGAGRESTRDDRSAPGSRSRGT